MSIRVAVVLAMAAVIVTARQLDPSEAATPPSEAAASDNHALRFPGRPGSRPRNPIFPGFPGARPSPPTSGFPGTRPSPTPVPGGVPSAPVSQAPCPKAPLAPLPGFPGMPGIIGSTPSSPTDCVTPLAGLMTCGTFLTGSESETPTPQSECCSGLAAFLNTSSAGSAAGDGDRTLRCLCPVILGDVNKMLPKPVDPVRMMYLPIACGVVLPPQVLFICFTGQPTPPLVSRIPDAWENPSSAMSP
ncbi:leucine-rich repeat extensin-like protein 5 [Phragmites australis]|uniref:leucine-rich repeat extensin-like protein 5 n=1 Tax=Phragmites australis TaxID=29695 RepID=UPI002D798917|nr:leucine-rich repeat extensin-like protein 5 [Phragmites australis]